MAGTPINMTFDVESAAFELCYSMNREIQAPTEIFASREHHYPGGAQVSHSSNVRVQAESEDLLFVRPAAEAEAEAGAEEVGCVRLSPRAEGGDAAVGGAQA